MSKSSMSKSPVKSTEVLWAIGTRGSVGGNHLFVVALATVVGFTALPTIGDAVTDATRGDVASEDTVVSAEGVAATAPHSNGDVALGSPNAENSNGQPGGFGDIEFQPVPLGSSDGGFLAGVGNFIHNSGFNPLEALRNPWEYVVVGGWNRVIGVGRFAWNTAWGLGTLAHNINELYNPLYPAFWYDLATSGPGDFVDRRVGVMQAGVDLVPGIASFSWETSIVGMGYDAIFNRETFFEDRLASWEDFKTNPVVQALYEPIGSCAGETSHGAMQSCGEVQGEVILTVLTGGVGRGASGAGRAGTLADDLATLADDAARLGDDAARLGDDAARLGDDAARLGDGTVSAADNGAGVMDDAATIRDAWSGFGVDDVTLAQMERYGITPDSDLYRWVEPEYLDDGSIAGNPNSMARVEDVYGPTQPNDFAQALLDEGYTLDEVREILPGSLDSHAYINASELGPTLNVSLRPGEIYAGGDRVLIRIQADDVIEAGGRIYPDRSGTELIDPIIVTTPESVPYQIVTP